MQCGEKQSDKEIYIENLQNIQECWDIILINDASELTQEFKKTFQIYNFSLDRIFYVSESLGEENLEF